MFCEECGHKNRNDRKYCAECGQPLPDYTKAKEDLLMPEDIEKEKEKVQAKNDIIKIFDVSMLSLLVSAILLTILSFLTKDTVQLSLIIIAIVCYVVLFVIKIIKAIKLKKMKKRNKKQ